MVVKQIPDRGKCYQCGVEVNQDGFCYGCEEFICDEEECGGAISWSLASATGHGHHPEDHFVEAE